MEGGVCCSAGRAKAAASARTDFLIKYFDKILCAPHLLLQFSSCYLPDKAGSVTLQADFF